MAEFSRRHPRPAPKVAARDVSVVAEELRRELAGRDLKTVPDQVPVLITLAARQQPRMRAELLERALATLRGPK